jgi:hypothetical protein
LQLWNFHILKTQTFVAIWEKILICNFSLRQAMTAWSSHCQKLHLRHRLIYIQAHWIINFTFVSLVVGVKILSFPYSEKELNSNRSWQCVFHDFCSPLKWPGNMEELSSKDFAFQNW